MSYVGHLQDGVDGVDGLNGARDILISPDGLHAYVTGYADHSVSWFERNSTTGALSYIGLLKDGVGGVDGLYASWDVTMSSNGLHVYVTGGADDAVSWYERNASTGALTYGGMLKDGVGGVDGLDGASFMVLSADGLNLYVASNADDSVSWYERNASTGALTYGGMLKDGVGGVDGLNGARGISCLGTTFRIRYRRARLRSKLVREECEHRSVDLRRNVEGRGRWGRWLEERRSITLSGDDSHAYITEYGTTRLAGMIAIQHGSVDLWGDVEGRSGWSGRFEQTRHGNFICRRKSCVCSGL